MKKQYPYSNDKEFLSKIDRLRIQEQWVRIILLDYSSEIPLKNIEGRIINGTLSKNGDSSVRRTCNLSCAVDTFKYNIEDIEADYSISKKIYLELGVTNNTDEYLDEKIIWFPQGVFFITGISIMASATGATSISLQLKDKMAQLDGTAGGVLPTTVRFDTVTTMINDVSITKKALVYDIIMETVNHFGGEDITNIIIDDIPIKAKRIIRWNGAESIWIYPVQNSSTHKISYDICFASDLDEKQSAYKGIVVDANKMPVSAKEYQPGQDIGYIYEDFVYDDELTFNGGAKVTDVLEQIKKWLGNYEYFYDEYGQFHFQEIKNYLNNNQSAEIWQKIIETDDTDYLYESTRGKSIYTFDDSINLINITNTPSYENIKNDFIVEGNVTHDNIKYTCRYHLVIDDKPTVTTEGYENILIYTDPIANNTTIIKPKIITPKWTNNKWVWALPDFGESGKIYGLLDEPKTLNLKKQLTHIDEFIAEYQTLINKENTLKNTENNMYVTLPSEIKEYLFNILENYMSYKDNSDNKEKYRDIIFTIVRQLRRYGVSKHSSRASTVAYYKDLNDWYETNKAYGQEVATKISWCESLLQLLYDSFNNITTNTRPNDSVFIDNDYWPAINITIPRWWENISSSLVGDTLRVARKNACLAHVNKIKIKQKQLQILINQYTQIINEYNTKITIAEKNESSTVELIETRNKIWDQINNYKMQLDVCGKRLTLLYATLTSLGVSEWVVDKTYYTVDVNIYTRASSFWYYNANRNQNTYGWNEVQWYKYYRNPTNPTSYYPDGLGSMTYIDYNSMDLNYTILDDSNVYPSMNRYSAWYQDYYKSYAKEYELPYFDSNDSDVYYCDNWRTELILQGLRAEENGIDPGYYYQELKANWPTVYDFKTNQLLASSIDYTNYFVGNTGVVFGIGNTYQFIDSDFNVSNSTSAIFRTKDMKIDDSSLNYANNNYYYFFDMIDSSSPTWGKYSVSNIGRRTNVNINNGVNCIFAPKIPDYAFINVSGLTNQERAAAYAELTDIAEDIIQVTDIFYKNFATGGYKQSAYEQIRYDLQQYTSYQNNLSIVAVPCFYLEPNTRVEINDRSTNTFGDYIVKSISISLGTGNMSLNLSKAMERI